jgi:hypothetical protein
VELRGLRSELISRYSGLVSNLQLEAAIGMRCPDSPMLRAKSTATGAHRDAGPGVGPIEPEVDIPTMTAAVNPTIRVGIVHSGVALALMTAKTSVIIRGTSETRIAAILRVLFTDLR